MKTNSFVKNVTYENLNYYYNTIINELKNDFISQFIQIEKSNLLQFKDIDENFTEIEYKINSPSPKNLKYIQNFELVEKDIKDNFIKNNIAKEEHFISLYSCIAENRRILIIFDKNNYNFYEIGYFNDNEDFIIEYLIDDLENTNKMYIINYFFNYGINNLIKYYSQATQGIINLDNLAKRICYYYKIEEKSKPKEPKRYKTYISKSITLLALLKGISKNILNLSSI